MGKLNPLFTSVLLLTLFLSLASSSAAWYDTLKIDLRVTVKPRLEFTSWKAHAYYGTNPRGRCLAEEGSVTPRDLNTSVRVAFGEFKYGWGWVGLVVSNYAGRDVNLSKNMVSVEVVRGNISRVYVFLYGPFLAPGTSGVWGDIDICELRWNLRNYSNPFPRVEAKEFVVLGRRDKAVIWVYLEGSPGTTAIEVRLRWRSN